MKPLYDTIAAYSHRVAAPFHMPGHKLGKGFIPKSLFADPARFDLTELASTDDLHDPRGPLLAAQTLAAEAFGAGKTWFLVNGSTSGIHAMVTANCAPGQKLIAVRNFHSSAFNAMRLARAKPVYVYPSAFPGSYPQASGDDVERAIAAHPDAAALYITRPDYFGNACILEPIVAAAHSHGMPVLVDEAHGAHFAFSSKLPASAMQAGADFCVQSAHKTLPAFTQGAYAHASAHALRAMPERAQRFEMALRALQTSSPSFLVLSSLDYAREYMQAYGARKLDGLAASCAALCKRASEAGYAVPPGATEAAHAIQPGSSEAGHGERNGVAQAQRDFTRLVIGVAPLGLGGPEVERMLAQEYAVVAEMSDDAHVVFISTVADSDADFELLGSALESVADRAARREATIANREKAPPCPTAVKTLCPAAATAPCASEGAGAGARARRTPLAPEAAAQLDFMEWLHSGREWATLESAAKAGRIAAELVTPYPPGVPLLCPGERVTPETAARLESLLRAGVHVKGLRPGRIDGTGGRQPASASAALLPVAPRLSGNTAWTCGGQ